MKTGRKNLKKASLEDCPEPQEGQQLGRVVAPRGSNLIEVEDVEGQRTLCLLPAKFHKSIWIKRGNYVLIEERDRQKALEANSKVTATISQVLFEDQVRKLRKTPFWPRGFGDGKQESSHTMTKENTEVELTECNSDSEENLPPLHSNLNRWMAIESSDSTSESSEED